MKSVPSGTNNARTRRRPLESVIAYAFMLRPIRRAGRTGTRVARGRQEVVMADDLKQTGKPDDARINVEQDHELGYWSEKLGVSRSS